MTMARESPLVTVLGAGVSGLTTAAELTNRGLRVHVVAAELGYQPPLNIVGTQSRRWPGSDKNEMFTNDDLLDKELVTVQRFIALCSDPESGVAIIPALKVSRRTEDNIWNRQLDPVRLSKASEIQRNLRMIVRPKNVSQEDIACFKKNGYKSIDETQVVRIETAKYFKYLIGIITSAGGSVELGTRLTKEEVDKLKRTGHVVNCLGNNAGSIGGGAGQYFSSPGECVIWKKCPRSFGFYVMDDDHSAGVMQLPSGELYLSSAAVTGPDQTRNTLSDCEGVCQALFGRALALNKGEGFESWKTDRPMRKEGFNVTAVQGAGGWVAVENSGHGNAGVATSWGCASLAVQALKDQAEMSNWAHCPTVEVEPKSV